MINESNYEKVHENKSSRDKSSTIYPVQEQVQENTSKHHRQEQLQEKPPIFYNVNL